METSTSWVAELARDDDDRKELNAVKDPESSVGTAPFPLEPFTGQCGEFPPT